MVRLPQPCHLHLGAESFSRFDPEGDLSSRMGDCSRADDRSNESGVGATD
jgi:hypothetical protein